MKARFVQVIMIFIILAFSGCFDKEVKVPEITTPKSTLPAWFYNPTSDCAVGTAKPTSKSTDLVPSNEQSVNAVLAARTRYEKATFKKLEPGTRTRVDKTLYKDKSLYILLCFPKGK